MTSRALRIAVLALSCATLPAIAAPMTAAEASAFEARLVTHYGDARVAMQMLQRIDRYESKALFELLYADVAKLAAIREDEARRCRILLGEFPAATGPRLPGGALGALNSVPVRPMRLDCQGAPPIAGPERNRMNSALWTIGKTDLPEAPKRLLPLLPRLAAVPPAEEGEALERRAAKYASQLRDLHSIADLYRRTRYVEAGPAMIALVRALKPKSHVDVITAWPFLQALAPMDRREGSELIADWIDGWSATSVTRTTTPTMAEMIRLLTPVLPAGQVEIPPLRDRVLARVPAGEKTSLERAFRDVDDMNRFLREPSEAGLVAWAMHNDQRMVAYLLSKGVSPDSRNAEGETALTASRHYFEMQRYLVEAGASPDLANRAGMTPFHVAVAWFYPNSRDAFQKVDYFHGKGADVNRVSTSQGTPLHTAASKSPQMVKYLIERGAKVNVATAEGSTPLIHAVHARNVATAELLLKAGSEVNVEVKGGITPLLIARDNQDAPMEALLERHGGRVNYAFVAKREVMRKLGPLLYYGH